MRILVASSMMLCCLVAGCHSDEPERKPVVDVQVQQATLADVPMVVNAPATIFGKSEARISARITAPIERLGAHMGDDVRRGQMLALLDSSDLSAQHADAAASVANARASLQRIANGSLPAELQRTQGDLAAKEAALNLAQKVYDHRRDLYKQGAISERELQISEADLAQAKANDDTARTALDVLQHHTSSSDLQMAKSGLAQSEARLALAQANLDFSKLTSPMNGTVTEQFMYPGDMAKPDMPLFTIVDLSTAVARAQVPANESGAIKPGQSCTFSETGVSSLSQTGTITVVNQAVDPARGSVEVWCEIPNPHRVLKTGLFGSVAIPVSVVRNAVVVPSAAVEFVEGSSQAKVYVVDAHRTAHLREVKAVPMSDGKVRILSRLSAGETVIVEGEYGLPDGTEVCVNGASK